MGRHFGLVNHTRSHNISGPWKGEPPSIGEVESIGSELGWDLDKDSIGSYSYCDGYHLAKGSDPREEDDVSEPERYYWANNDDSDSDIGEGESEVDLDTESPSESDEAVDQEESYDWDGERLTDCFDETFFCA